VLGVYFDFGRCQAYRDSPSADLEVCRLTDVINMLVERQLTVNHHTQTLNTVECLDVHLCQLYLLQSSPDSGKVH